VDCSKDKAFQSRGCGLCFKTKIFKLIINLEEF